MLRQTRDTILENMWLKFQVDSFIRTRDIVYTVLKNLVSRKTRLKFRH